MKGVLFSVFLLLIWTAAAKAVTLNVDFSGQLRGASGVDVAGVLYDVEFEEGSCNELFGGCDTDADFPFATPEAARQASLALLDPSRWCAAASRSGASRSGCPACTTS